MRPTRAFNNATQPPVLLIGEVLVDRFADALVPGGAPFNVARTLAAFGVPTQMITRLGNDAAGAALLDEFHRFGLPLDGVQRDPRHPTGVVEITMTDTGHEFAIGADAAWDVIDPVAAGALARKLAPGIVCYGTLAQRAVTSRAAVAAVLHDTDALKILDLNLRPGADQREIAALSLDSADVVKVNDAELAQLFEWFLPTAMVASGDPDAASYRLAVGHLVHRFALKNLIITRGAKGCLAFDAGGKLVARGDAPETSIVDTVGAGDGFLAVLVLGLWLDWPLDKTLARAGQFAAGVCGIRGAVADNRQFYDRWAARWLVSAPPITTHP